MKTIRILAFVLFCFFCSACTPTYAINTGLDLESIPTEKKTDYITSLSLQRIDAPIKDTVFCCFDICSIAGKYALGFDLDGSDIVQVFNSSGEYLYGFSFTNNGTFGIEWDEDNVIIYPARNDLAFSINEEADCVDVRYVKNTIDNHQYIRGKINAKQKELNGIIYRAKPGLGGYTQLVSYTQDGAEQVLYGRSTIIDGRVIGFLFLWALLFVMAIVFVVYKAATIKSNN